LAGDTLRILNGFSNPQGGMLAEQKKYLYPKYVILNNIAAILFCLISVITGFLNIHIFSLWVWILCYLLPILLLIAIFSEKIWFAPISNPWVAKRIWIIVLALMIGSIAIFTWISFSISNSNSADKFFPIFLKTIRYDILFIGIGYSFCAMMLIVFRWHLIQIIKKGDIEKQFIKAVLMVGADEPAKRIALSIDNHPEWGLRIIGHLTSSQNHIDQPFQNHRIVGTIDALGHALRIHVVDMVMIASDRLDKVQIDAIVQRCHIEGVDIAFAMDHHDIDDAILIKEKFNDLSLNIFKFVYQQPEMLFLKRVFDLSLSIIIICVFLPVWLVVPLLIWFESQGPIFYRGKRVGKGGRRFPMLKFRTMTVGWDKKQHKLMHIYDMHDPVFKMKNDRHITRVGRFLCKTGLDELPRLLNIVKGDLSLVGPQPKDLDEVCQYRPWEKKRLSVTQGITGFRQISGRNEIKFDEGMKLDLLYVEEWDFMLDMTILMKTTLAIIAGKGAR
jgi:exopolysaccharide biosynthesis polyprenyl glycosylphosphotransferase